MTLKPAYPFRHGADTGREGHCRVLAPMTNALSKLFNVVFIVTNGSQTDDGHVFNAVATVAYYPENIDTFWRGIVIGQGISCPISPR